MSTVNSNWRLVIRPTDTAIAVKFLSEACSSSTANDGNIPYGTSVSSAVVTAYDDDDSVVADLVDSYSVANNIVTVIMSYPSTSGAGKYSLRMTLTLSDASTQEERYDKIEAI